MLNTHTFITFYRFAYKVGVSIYVSELRDKCLGRKTQSRIHIHFNICLDFFLPNGKNKLAFWVKRLSSLCDLLFYLLTHSDLWVLRWLYSYPLHMSGGAIDLIVESHNTLPLLSCPKPVLAYSAWLLWCFSLLVFPGCISHFVLLITAFASAGFLLHWYCCSSHESRANKNSSKYLTCYSMNRVFYTDLPLCFSVFPLSPVFSPCIRCSSNT